MKFTLKTPKAREGASRRWPRYLAGGRVRTSTLVLIVAFLAVWWVYATYRTPEPSPSQVVPPGYVPNPNYTWVPRTNVRESPQATPTTSIAPSGPNGASGPAQFVLPPSFGPGSLSPDITWPSPVEIPPPQALLSGSPQPAS
ncbi:hypothetical protein [Mycobacterium sp.]|uniref:hypothetical protein n=1 Tax=Mycobacterium sp. TaxID=1785 RepID=UPI003BAD877F